VVFLKIIEVIFLVVLLLILVLPMLWGWAFDRGWNEIIFGLRVTQWLLLWPLSPLVICSLANQKHGTVASKRLIEWTSWLFIFSYKETIVPTNLPI
jgi:hypothetical protein